MKLPREDVPLSPTSIALRLSLAYALIGTTWILFSDQLLAALGLPRDLEHALASAKGFLYVLVTSVALYVLAFSRAKSIDNERKAIAEQERRIRQAYVDVLTAVTGGKLVLVTSEEMRRTLGAPISQARLVTEPQQLAEARMFIEKIGAGSLSPDDTKQAALAVGEALTNALVHGGSAEYQLMLKGESLQVSVRDHGPGIDFRTLPKATLVPGFSTGQSLGMGFTIMLQTSERVYIETSQRGTTLVLEFD